jgi:hypothetical protein
MIEVRPDRKRGRVGRAPRACFFFVIGLLLRPRERRAARSFGPIRICWLGRKAPPQITTPPRAIMIAVGQFHGTTTMNPINPRDSRRRCVAASKEKARIWPVAQ